LVGSSDCSSIGEVAVVRSLVGSSDCSSIGEVAVVGLLVGSLDCSSIGEVVVFGSLVDFLDCLDKFFLCFAKQAIIKKSIARRLYASEFLS
jgi:hypothetical protein